MLSRFLPFTHELPQEILNVVEIIQSYEHIVFLGTGGSSLCGQALKGIAPSDKITFFDNIDPRTFREKILPLAKAKTFFVIISKSGGTSETLTQTISLLPYLSDNVLVITEKKNSPLMELAKTHHWRMMEHPADIGGRFSAFTIVGLLPCLLLGLRADKFIKGALNALAHQTIIEDRIRHVFYTYPYQKMVLLSYSDYTHPLLLWMSQLISESLGKADINGDPQGITPLVAKGTCDQHSQLQLWMEGPKDQIFEIFFFNDPLDESKLRVDFTFQSDTLRQLDKRSYNEIFKAHSLATKTALEQAGYFVMYKEYPILNEETLGMIMMEKIIEVFHLAKLMNVEPEGQPGVEKAKTVMRQYL